MQKKYWLLLLFTTVAISFFAYLFHYPVQIIFYHIHVCFIILFISNLINKKIKNKKIKASFNAFVFFMFSVFYTSVFVSNNAYQQTLNIPLIAAFIKDINSYNSLLPISAYLILLLAFFYYLCLLGIFYKFDKDNTQVKYSKAIKLSIITLIALLIWKKRDYQKEEEPIITMLFGDTSSSIFMTKKRADIGLKDIQEKEQFTDTLTNKKNVIIILVDALRAENTTMYGYKRKTSPFLQQLYDDKKIIKVKNAVATCACSECGVASMLFSKNWANIGYNGFSLVGLLKKVGFQTHFVLSGYSKNWSPIYDFFKTDLNSYAENEGGFALGDDESVIYGLNNLKIDYNKPQFFYLHLMSAHKAGIKHKKFEHFTPTMMMRDLAKTKSDFEKVFNYYDNGVIQADNYIQRIFKILEQKKILDKAVVIICADHADALGEHGLTGHVNHLYNSVNRIPIFIYDNNFSKYKNTTFWRQIDIAPTITDVLGLKIPKCWQGKSALQNKIEPYSYHQTSVKRNTQYSIIKNTDSAIYKLLIEKSENKMQLFNIKKDSNELNNLINKPNYLPIKNELIQKFKTEFNTQFE